MPAHRALLHHVLLMRRHVGIAHSMADRMLRLFPVERANARVRTRRHAHAATDALIVVLTNRTGFRIFVRCSNRAHLHARRILAMLARNSDILHRQIRVCSRRSVGIVPAIRQDAVPPNTVRQVVLHFARHRTRSAGNAPFHPLPHWARRSARRQRLPCWCSACSTPPASPLWHRSSGKWAAAGPPLWS